MTFLVISGAPANQTAIAQTRRIYTVKSTVVKVSPKKDFDEDERQVYALINAERRKKRLGDLVWNYDLARMARAYSQKMARGNFFSHSDREGANVVSRASALNIKGWRKLGENLFYCEGTDDFDSFAVEGWMKSSGHRQNILDKNYTATGIGIAESGGRIYITQVFIQK